MRSASIRPPCSPRVKPSPSRRSCPAASPTIPESFPTTGGGLLAYAIGERLSTLVWRDRSGKRLDDLAGGATLLTPRISPDGKRVAFARTEGSNTDIWIADLIRGETTRLTFDPAVDRWPVWSPDGTMITYWVGHGR